jgi:hypothetical protein
MANKRISLLGSEELFRPTRPIRQQDIQSSQENTYSSSDDPQVQQEQDYPRRKHIIALTDSELELLLEAIQTAKYPEKIKPIKIPLEKFERLENLRKKLLES